MIRSVQHYKTKRSNGKIVFLLCGFGGRIWQTKRLIGVLNRAGYTVCAMDFSKDSLASGDTTILTNLVTEVCKFIETETKDVDPHDVLLVGISLGALLSLNVIRRSNRLFKAVLITGGDIAKIAQKLYPKKWPQSHESLAQEWQANNMYSKVDELRSKKLLFVLHLSSKLIDAQDAYREIEHQNTAGNTLLMVERTKFDHVGTIIDETVLHPSRVLEYIQKVEQ